MHAAHWWRGGVCMGRQEKKIVSGASSVPFFMHVVGGQPKFSYAAFDRNLWGFMHPSKAGRPFVLGRHAAGLTRALSLQSAPLK